jgi:hypothetical protein
MLNTHHRQPALVRIANGPENISTDKYAPLGVYICLVSRLNPNEIILHEEIVVYIGIVRNAYLLQFFK